MKAKNPLQLMILGTGSDVGKSIIAAGFCRILKRRGYRVAPFKAQNMALNSFVTMDGKEMGRAQVIQAQAAGISPHSDMNPLLLKPSGGSTTQVILQGKVIGNTDAQSYYLGVRDLENKVMESYKRLSKQYDAIILEGAGSAVEMNLKDRDIVNFSMAQKASCPVILVADIDRGGVFASLYGTMRLLKRAEKRLVIGFIINKFRGDRKLFDDGIAIIEKLTHRPVFGILPWMRDIRIPEEDSVALSEGKRGILRGHAEVQILVIYLPFISNYTDFDPFEIEPAVSLIYSRNPKEINNADVVIIPGTKNTIEDLLWLKQNGFEEALRKHVENGKILIGICGGYQMLGIEIEDAYCVESQYQRVQGLGYLPIRTILEREKTLTRVRALCNIDSIAQNLDGDGIVEGYEIHMGSTSKIERVLPAFTIISGDTGKSQHEDGATMKGGQIWGTYLHGIFENDAFRFSFLKAAGRKDGEKLNYRNFLDLQFDKLADIIEEHINVDRILSMAKRFLL